MRQQSFDGRAGIVQRVLAPYRVSLFDSIAARCADGLSIFAGDPSPGEPLKRATHTSVAKLTDARNVHLFNGKYYLFRQPRLTNWLSHWQPDIVIADANPRNLSIPSLIRWMHKRGRCVLGHGLGILPLSTGWEYLRAVGRRHHYQRFDGLIAYSELAAEQFRGLGIADNRIFVAHNAIAGRPIGAMPDRAEAFQNYPTIIFVGRLIEGKRVELLIEACAALEEDLKPELQIVGDGPQRASLERLTESLAVRARFRGDLRDAALTEAFLESDLFVLPGLGGLSIQEAMAHALPVVVADGDGTQYDLVRPSNGWHVVPGDCTDMTNTLRLALSDPRRLRRMGEKSFEIVRDEINLQTMSDKIVAALNCAVAWRR
jgi:glycosyltransferase involved in cell wall biosynthesis